MAVVLLIEDDESQRFIAAFALRKAGHEVHEAADGTAGIARAQQLKPEAIVCDVMMPGLSGYEVVAALRKDPDLGSTPIVLLTAMAERKHMRQGMTAGADDYLTKPYRPDELCEAVNAVLQRKLTQHEAFLNSMTQVVEGALEEQKEHLGRRYEQQLAKEVNARWQRQATAGGDVHYASAILLQADLLGAGCAAPAPDLPERLKRSHQQARDTLYLFGASHVLPYGSDVVAVFADEATVTTPVPVRAARAALALAKAAGKDAAIAIGLHTGPIALVALHDPLHGDSGHSLVPNEALATTGALRDFARANGWRIVASGPTGEAVQEAVTLGRRAVLPGGETVVELVPSAPA